MKADQLIRSIKNLFFFCYIFVPLLPVFLSLFLPASFPFLPFFLSSFFPCFLSFFLSSFLPFSFYLPSFFPTLPPSPVSLFNILIHITIQEEVKRTPGNRRHINPVNVLLPPDSDTLLRFFSVSLASRYCFQGWKVKELLPQNIRASDGKQCVSAVSGCREMMKMAEVNQFFIVELVRRQKKGRIVELLKKSRFFRLCY